MRPYGFLRARWLWASALLVILALAAVALPLRTPVSAAGITLTPSVDAKFPTLLTFKVKAQSDSRITSLRIQYTVNRRGYAKVVSEGWAQFNPANSVDAQWPLDMRRAGLPTATQLTYWWLAQDAAGNTAQSSPLTITFDDTRFKWQSIVKGPITLYWYKGDNAFANTIMDSAQQGLQKIGNDTGAVPQGSVKIFIYASSADLQSAQLFAQAWEGGVSFSDFNVIAIGVGTNELDYGKRAVPHELSHWIVGQITFNNYGAGLPVWLEEGLATYGEGPLLPDYQAALNFAVKNNRLLSVRSLSSPFSADSQTAYISYAESNSIATFLIQKYGKDKMRQLLEAFHQGATYDGALIQVYGFDQDGLDTLWKQSIGVKTVRITPQPALAAGRLM